MLTLVARRGYYLTSIRRLVTHERTRKRAREARFVMGYHTECASKAKYQLQGSIAADTLKIYLLLQHYLFVGLRPLYHQPTN
jgi:hypothetical protein